jgi:hypothetical protein
MRDETKQIQQEMRQHNKNALYMLRYGINAVAIKCPPRFEPMPLECCAASMPGIREVPCSLH